MIRKLEREGSLEPKSESKTLMLDDATSTRIERSKSLEGKLDMEPEESGLILTRSINQIRYPRKHGEAFEG